MADEDYSKKIGIDILALILSIIALIARAFIPIFYSDVVKWTSICIEVARPWILINVILLKLCHFDLDPIGILLILLIGIFLCVIFNKVCDYRLHKVIIQSDSGIGSIKNDTQYEIYIQTISKLINESEQMMSYNSTFRKDLVLQGILQTHITNCDDKDCPCFTFDELTNQL